MAEITNQVILDKLTAQFGEVSHSLNEPWGPMSIRIPAEKNVEVIQFLRDDAELQFTFLTTLCGVHYPERKEKFDIVYHMHSWANSVRLRIKCSVAGEPPHIRSMENVFRCANWMERETYDFFGIIFDGHPNLKRILNVDDMTIFPMRKEYPLEDNTRIDKDDTMFGRDENPFYRHL